MPSESTTPAEGTPAARENDITKYQKLTGTRSRELQNKLVNQALSTTPSSEISTRKDKERAIDAALAAMAGLAPQDEAEGMLAAQMVATHNAALTCLRRGIHAETVPSYEMNLKHAEKLMGLYARQLEALDKHRGKGQQKITVEHVNVHAGGQAIVGSTVAAPPKAGREPQQSSAAPPALSDHSAESRPLIDGGAVGKRTRQKSRAR